jgi:hypothetical protein
MEKHVVNMTEFEGHLLLYHDRNMIWNELKQNGILIQVCHDLKEDFERLQRQWNTKKDGALFFQIEWQKCVIFRARDMQYFEGFSQKMEKFAYHRDCIMQSIGKHSFSYLQNASKTKLRPPTTTKKHKNQSDSGIRVLAGGVLGQMFRLYKKHRKQYSVQLKILAKVIVTDKTKNPLPVEQAARDRGGLYAINMCFMATLKTLDSIIRVELQKRHGKKFSQVCVDLCTYMYFNYTFQYLYGSPRLTFSLCSVNKGKLRISFTSNNCL